MTSLVGLIHWSTFWRMVHSSWIRKRSAKWNTKSPNTSCTRKSSTRDHSLCLSLGAYASSRLIMHQEKFTKGYAEAIWRKISWHTNFSYKAILAHNAKGYGGHHHEMWYLLKELKYPMPTCFTDHPYMHLLALCAMGNGYCWSISAHLEIVKVPDSWCRLLHKMDRERAIGLIYWG